MSVELRKTRLGDVYTIRYRDSRGVQRRETLGPKSEGWTKSKARREEAVRRLEPSNGLTEPVDFEALAWQWYDETARLHDWKPRTLMAYTRSIKRLRVFYGMHVDEIRPVHVAQFIAGHPYAGKTTNGDISVLRAILGYGVTHELLDTNPAAKSPRPKNKRKDWRILSPEEIQRVDAAFDDEKARLMFRVLTRTAIRRHELRQLLVRDFDFNRKILRVTDSKTEEGIRSIAIPESLALQVSDWVETGLIWPHGRINPDSYVFQSGRGNMVGAQWYTDAFNRALKKAGITDYVRPFHDMRHTALTNEAATGKSNPIALMTKAGHRSFKTTQEYIKLAGTVFPEEAEALEERYNNV
jgi:integrase